MLGDNPPPPLGVMHVVCIDMSVVLSVTLSLLFARSEHRA